MGEESASRIFWISIRQPLDFGSSAEVQFGSLRNTGRVTPGPVILRASGEPPMANYVLMYRGGGSLEVYQTIDVM